MAEASPRSAILSPAAKGPRLPLAATAIRPEVRGKFIFTGTSKLFVRGVTYGTFRPNDDGTEFPDPARVDRDFAEIASNGLNAVRTYSLPPVWLLDTARHHGLWVMVGLPWEQHVAFLDDRSRARDIEQRVRAGVRSCAGHPAVLCYAVGNEIPAPIARWHGRRRLERFIERLYLAAKQEDPSALATYVNYPSTEYLQLPFLDLMAFNVFLESEDRMGAYIIRLQNIGGERPLLMTEVGLDSRSHGEARQAETLRWQIRTAFDGGCAGAFVFSWTDEWHRGGLDIEGWAFGLTDAERRPKLALEAVRRTFAETPFQDGIPWPRISVVVCTHNGGRTIAQCLDGLFATEYPEFEVVVVDDGSTDSTAEIAARYPVRLIRTPNRGLSSARNTGLAAATGEIVAYIDDDAYPDPHWLSYLAMTFLDTPHAGVGGPNISPPGDGTIAECVAHSPGGPIHVLLTDQEAEHIPGCNMAFRKAALQAIGGFDPRFWTAGDDVDVCWRLQEQGFTLGFSPSAVVWHHRRNSVRAYWRQQRGYGRAEALLESKWPEKYNAAGHLSWAGRIYGNGHGHTLGRRQRIYHGTWGSAPFQTLVRPVPSLLRSLPSMPEWHLVIAILASLSAQGLAWRPLLLAAPLLGLAVLALLTHATLAAVRAPFQSADLRGAAAWKVRSLTAFLHVLQPLARLAGRIRHGLTPWRRRGASGFALPRPRTATIWSERWRQPEEWIRSMEGALKSQGASVLQGGDYDRWDLEARDGMLTWVRLRMAIEEHGAGRQLVRCRSWPRLSPAALGVTVLLAGLASLAGVERAFVASALLATMASLLLAHLVLATATASGAVKRAIASVRAESDRWD
jgi:GT2 family glycosyltransferase